MVPSLTSSIMGIVMIGLSFRAGTTARESSSTAFSALTNQFTSSPGPDFDFIGEDFIVLHPGTCDRRVMTTTTGYLVEFPDSAVDTVATSRQICVFDGKPLAVGKCVRPDAVATVATPRVGDLLEQGSGSAENEADVTIVAPEWTVLSAHNCTNPASENSSVVTEQLAELYSESALSSTNHSVVASLLAVLTSNVSSLTWLDVVYTAEILDNIAHSTADSQDAEHFLTTVDNIAQVSDETQLQAGETRHSLNRIVSAVNKLVDTVQLPTAASNLTLVRPSVAVQVWNLRKLKGNALCGFGVEDLKWKTTADFHNYLTPNLKQVQLTGSESVILLSDEVLDVGRKMPVRDERLFSAVGRDRLRVGFTVYRSGDFFVPSPNQSDVWQNEVTVNSLVLSASIGGVKIANLVQPVTVIMALVQPNATGRQRCAFWNESRFEWSTEGVSTDGTVNNGTSLLCRSRHLTNFAVIAGYDLARNSVVSTVLEILSIIGLTLSIAGLSLTIISQLIVMKSGRKGRAPLVLMHLSVAVLAVDVVVLVGVDKTESEVGCKVVAALLLYFLLASFSWMLVEAVLQYLRFVRVLGTYTDRFMLKAGLPAWLIPGVVVGVVAAVDVKIDMLRGPVHYCWLSRTAFYFAFLVPLGLVMIVNIILFILIIKGLCSRPRGLQSTQNKKEMAKLQVLAVISCFIVMGLTWVFAFLAIDRATTVMQFLFCIFNSLQGFLVFVFLNVREPSIRKAWYRACSCCRRPPNERKSNSGGKKPNRKDSNHPLNVQHQDRSEILSSDANTQPTASTSC